MIETVGLSPRIGGDEQLVAVLIEAIDERGEAGGAGEHGAHCLNARFVLMIVERSACRRLMML